MRGKAKIKTTQFLKTSLILVLTLSQIGRAHV